MVAQMQFDFKEFVASRRQLVENTLASYLDGSEPAVLWDSMRYSVLGGGKRLRALLCLASADAFDGEELALPCACAIELVHAMSLIHDDLPALDNDDLRRGRPTNHKVFGEAMALLAGDALLMLAVEILLRHTPGTVAPAVLLDVATELSSATGAGGMVGGQVDDMSFTGLSKQPDRPVDAKMLEAMHSRKTGALIRFASWSGARLAGAGESQLALFSRFGEILGLAFQITDDLLDVTGSAETLGKTPGKDDAADKATFVSLFGVDGSRARLASLEDEARGLIASAGLVAHARIAMESLLEYSIHRVN